MDNKKLTISGYARHIGVAYATVRYWEREGKIKTYRPAPGVVLIDADTPRPEAERPWYKNRKIRIDRDR